ncbi:MAG: hypothetical protein AB1414_15395 [bacterium]
MLKKLVILSVVIFVGSNSYAGFKDVGIGARNLGMGKSVVSVCDDIETIYWNPAGLVELGEITGMSFSHASLYGVSKANMDSFCIVQPNVYLLEGNIGLIYLAEDVVDKISGETKKTDITETTIGLSYGKRLRLKKNLPFSLSTGGNLKFLKAEDASDKHRGYAIDLGVLMKPKYGTKQLQNVRLGVMLRNILASNINDPGFGFKFGIATNLNKNLTLWKTKIDNILITTGIADEKGDSFKFQLGTEAIFNQKIAWRLGFYGSDISTGLGYKGVDWQIDYAFAKYDLGNTHIISAMVKY